MTENDESKPTRKLARRRLVIEALVLFVFAWIACDRDLPFTTRPDGFIGEFWRIAVHRITFVSGIECFVFGYVLSRFFKQFKTGCAVVIILFFAYLIWAGRR